MALDAAACLLAAAALVCRAAQLGALGALFDPAPLASAAWWACVLGISLLYALHAFIWNCPRTWAAACGLSHPVRVFARLEVLGKLWQAACLTRFFGRDGGSALLAAAAAAPPWCLGVSAALVASGQALNLAMYWAIGSAGVYYGFKYGCDVPWCSGFPFNAGLRHPQYVGVVFTIFGLALPALSAETAEAGLGHVCGAWALMYAGMSAMEQSGDADSSDVKKR